MTNTRRVRTLIGHRQLSVGLVCLPSLLRLSSEPLRLVIHDDGTLTDQDTEDLIAALPGSTVLGRAEADALMLPLLSRHPRCRAYRERHPLGLKLFDTALLEASELAYCDSDILFLKPYTGLFAWPDPSGKAIFMQDIQEAYSLRPWHTYPLGSIRVPRKINSGLLLFRASEYDLDFIEWLLGRQQLEGIFKKRPHWIEQTCWAALGWRVGCRVWSDRQFIIASPEMRGFSDETVGIHFVAASRGKLNEYLGRPSGREPNGHTVAIRSTRTKASTSVHLLIEDARKKIRL